MSNLLYNKRLYLLVLAFILAFPAVSTAHAKHYFHNLEIDSEQLLAWCEKMEFKGKIKAKTKHKLRNWRWKYCEELLRNKEPVAVIEGPETAQVHSYFTLDASGSTDPEGEALSFVWTQLGGTPAQSVNSVDHAMPQFYLASGGAGEDLLFELAISDGENNITETISVSIPVCNDEPGLIFGDCFSATWNSLSAWEFLMDGSGANYQLQSGHNENFIKWQILDSGSAEYTNVIDIQYAPQSGFNALPQVRPAGIWSSIDMSAYAGGTIQFDVRVLDWGVNVDGLELKIECYWPCESAAIPLEINAANEWQHIVISVDELAQSGADLTNLDVAFQVYPIWDQQAGVHYQLDNIRWSHEPPPPPAEYPCEYDASVVFQDCITAAWIPSIYENNTQELVLAPAESTENAEWSVVDLQDGVRNNVIDVRFFQNTGFADFSFRAIAENGSTHEDLTNFDLSAYANGDFVFDLKIVDYGLSQLGMFMHVQCGWPCRSQYLPVANTTGFNSIAPPGFPLLLETGVWVEVRVPVAYLTNDNLSVTDPDLNLSLVDVIVISPPWASATELMGFHYQLDNIRFENP